MQQARWGKFKMSNWYFFGENFFRGKFKISNWYFFGVKTGEADEAIKLACKGVLTEV